jgi:hypothetical protein
MAGKDKTVPVLLIKRYTVKVHGGVNVKTLIFLILALVAGEWSDSHPSTHWIEG